MKLDYHGHWLTWVLGFLLPLRTHAGPAAVWSFDDITNGITSDSVGGIPCRLHGGWSRVAGVSGSAVLLDGLTAYGQGPSNALPALDNGFTVASWVALGSYPLTWAPVVDLHDPNRCGFFFGFDSHGRAGLGLRAGETWQAVTAPTPLGLYSWHHLAATYDPSSGISLYVDGRAAEHAPALGCFVPPRDLSLLVGKHRFQLKPDGSIRPNATASVFDYLDGALDELRIFNRSLAADEVRREFLSCKPPTQPPLQPRVLPSGPAGNGAFGAFYTKLHFYPQWDAPWRIGDYSDVVVRFADRPFRFVFWHGTSYIPHWVTENGIWFNNEFTETWAGVEGCGEPMSDKQCRFSHVRIIENNEARTVVHWRYALADVFYRIARQEPDTGWGDWTDEIYTIYPDGTSVRDVTLHSSHPEQPHEWQESIVVLGPGFSPESAIEPAAITLANDKGEAATYSWDVQPPPQHPRLPEHPCIQLVRTKSRFRPYSILRPQDEPTVDVYTPEIRREVSMFPWWNHWPAASAASDGRYAMAADRPSHASLTHLYWSAYQKGEGWMRKIMLAGVTEQPATNLVALERSWASPAPLTITGQGFKLIGYDPAQKAYIISADSLRDRTLTLVLHASKSSPLINPAFVVLNMGSHQISVQLNGKKLDKQNLRIGRRPQLEGESLVLWLNHTSETDQTLRLKED